MIKRILFTVIAVIGIVVTINTFSNAVAFGDTNHKPVAKVICVEDNCIIIYQDGSRRLLPLPHQGD